MRRIATATGLLLAVLALAGCGNRRELKPLAGAELPAPGYGQGYRPSADDLLAVPVQAAPARNVELRQRSEDREDDPYDLPPEN
ncbi:MAG: hypothetical protein KGL48_06490 [Sphingomonadales bacterium]|nr:hypothetical protein [Sphingomonadales bacterium]MDE2568570.1 hypothetical protein [Sphingomonadales bacterium]